MREDTIQKWELSVQIYFKLKFQVYKHNGGDFIPISLLNCSVKSWPKSSQIDCEIIGELVGDHQMGLIAARSIFEGMAVAQEAIQFTKRHEDSPPPLALWYPPSHTVGGSVFDPHCMGH